MLVDKYKNHRKTEGMKENMFVEKLLFKKKRAI